MPSYFTLRMQFHPDDDPELIKELAVRPPRPRPVDEVMVFFAGEEYNLGHDPVERMQYWIERSRPYRQMLHERGPRRKSESLVHHRSS